MHSAIPALVFFLLLPTVAAHKRGHVSDHASNCGGGQNHHDQRRGEVDHEDIDLHPLRILEGNDQHQGPKDSSDPGAPANLL